MRMISIEKHIAVSQGKQAARQDVNMTCLSSLSEFVVFIRRKWIGPVIEEFLCCLA